MCFSSRVFCAFTTRTVPLSPCWRAAFHRHCKRVFLRIMQDFGAYEHSRQQLAVFVLEIDLCLHRSRLFIQRVGETRNLADEILIESLNADLDGFAQVNLRCDRLWNREDEPQHGNLREPHDRR